MGRCHHRYLPVPPGRGCCSDPYCRCLLGPPLPSHHWQAIRSVHLQTPQSTAPATPHEAKWRGSLARSVELTTPEAGGSATTSPKPAKTMRRAIMISRTVDNTKTLRARSCKTVSSRRQACLLGLEFSGADPRFEASQPLVLVSALQSTTCDRGYRLGMFQILMLMLASRSKSEELFMADCRQAHHSACMVQ